MSKTEKSIRHGTATIKIIPCMVNQFRVLINGHEVGQVTSYAMALGLASDVVANPGAFNLGD